MRKKMRCMRKVVLMAILVFMLAGCGQNRDNVTDAMSKEAGISEDTGGGQGSEKGTDTKGESETESNSNLQDETGMEDAPEMADNSEPEDGLEADSDETDLEKEASEDSDSSGKEAQNDAQESGREDGSADKKSAEGIRPEFQEAMDSYEAFYDKYCEILKKYMENPSDLKLLGEYAEMMEKSAEMTEKFEAWENEEMSNEELLYYLEVNNRITQKLVEAAASE